MISLGQLRLAACTFVDAHGPQALRAIMDQAGVALPLRLLEDADRRRLLSALSARDAAPHASALAQAA